MIVKGPVFYKGVMKTYIYEEGIDYVIDAGCIEFLSSGGINGDAKEYMKITGEKYCPLELEYKASV